MSWKQATEFCRKLSEKEDRLYRLPTEAEWEYACRADSETTRHFTHEDGLLRDYAYYKESSQGHTYRVGRLRPNAFGLYDMYGNVSEWCGDRYLGQFYANSASDDPRGREAEFATTRVLRGGSWDTDSLRCRSAYRFAESASNENSKNGFRVVQVIGGQVAALANAGNRTNPHTVAQPVSLARRLAGTTWVNSNDVTFEWTSGGELLHNGTSREWRVLDEHRVQIVFSDSHADTLVFNGTLDYFKQLIQGGPGSFTGRLLDR